MHDLMEIVRFCVPRTSTMARYVHLVVLGAVHGNEPCGAEAIARMIADIRAQKITLTCGMVTFVPITNPRAYAQGVRFIDRNLNRHCYPKAALQAYEDGLDAPLCALLDEADYLLDIHSYQSQGGAFCFLGTSSAQEIAFARALNVSTYIHGWAEAFSRDATEEQQRASLGTTDRVRANKRGACAVTLECGHHSNPDNADIAYDNMMRAMHHVGMVDRMPCEPVEYATQQCIRMHSVYYKERDGALVQPWKHGDRVALGQVIARYADGTEIRAPKDGVLVLPKTTTDHTLGSEWFYFGEEVAFPKI
ncbi:MAG: hypothetical protein EAZ74_01460 [Alphaproteobacteria bacterium]|nr:MAG: hypothetical protein EAZ74_01460 [Alphaproteobacteria bacterium]TAF41995.1 MAG: hypothetical protein EAZ66_00205 [Alphaproteobacteria bacterium]TAF76603.1 MAG: hypothetical protein EAZ52_03500 [Alphaproteobacteria bacterium]